ncbi:hypothetical protein [Elizabethkingia anophelis]|uniref:hypothetical protein n=1 Tax=Elizabethkingia anophelis TaxID=1117645 RepID=UPI0021A6F036|nr:hypothetical protein [Elizabethkingia anophelis]
MEENEEVQQSAGFPKRDLQIHGIASFILDLEAEQYSTLETEEDDSDYMRFIQGIVHQISTQEGRQFIINSEHTEVINILQQIVNNDTEFKTVESIAERLLRVEVEAQGQIARLGKQLHEGLLIISHIVDRGVEKIVICKAETLSYIERKTFTQQDGFPLKKKIFKSAQITFDSEKKVLDIFINDINDTIPKYWWDSFLELSKKYEDEENTKRAFTMIESKILKPIKKESNPDYWNLRNTTIHYFRSNEEFEIDDYIERCLSDYVPEKEGLVIESLKDKVRELPKKFAFDSKFSLIKKAITAKIKSTINLQENIDLVLKGEVNPGVIQVMINEKQEKGIFIKTISGYSEFGG